MSISNAGPAELRTTFPLWFPHYSTAPDHLHRVVDGIIVLAPEPVGIGATLPSKLATDMVLRVVKLHADPDYRAGSKVVNAAADESVAMLGAYIKRLERIAQQYADHLVNHSCTCLPHD